MGPAGFQELRKRTGIAPRVLSARLRDLGAAGYVESVAEGTRSRYAVTDRGRSLEPIIASIARWYVLEAMRDHEVDTRNFTATSPQSILEILPFIGAAGVAGIAVGFAAKDTLSNLIAGVLLIVIPVYLGGVLYYGGSPRTTDVGYQPVQPLPYSHAQHAGELGIDCRYCHNTVESAATAAVPEPAALSLLALGAVALLRRRSA